MNIAAPFHYGAAGLAERLFATRRLTLDLAAPLSDADATIQPHPTPRPPNGTWRTRPGSSRPSCCVIHAQGYRLFGERWAYLFNNYYEGEGARHLRPKRGKLEV